MTTGQNLACEADNIRQGILDTIDWMIDQSDRDVPDKGRLLDALRRVESVLESYIDECGD